MGVLQRFERRLGGLVEGAFAKVFKGGVEPVEIASALARETDDRRAISSNRVLVPNEFAVELASSDFARLAPYTAQLCDELGEMVREHAGEQRYTFVGPVRVRLSEAPDLDVGVFRIRSSVAAAEPGVVGGRRPASSRSARPSGPRLVVSRKSGAPGAGDDRDYALDAEVTVIGRGERSDIRLNDTGVSRHHGEVRRLPDGAFLYVDNGSTNGSIVNGRRATEVKLVDGDRIELGAAVLTFRREDGPGAERARAARSGGGPAPLESFGPAGAAQPPGRPGYSPRPAARGDAPSQPGRERAPGYRDRDPDRDRNSDRNRDRDGNRDRERDRSDDRHRSRSGRDAPGADPQAGGVYEGDTIRPRSRPSDRGGDGYPPPGYGGAGPRGGADRRPEPRSGYDSGRDRGGRGGRSGGDPYGGYGGSGYAGSDVPPRGYPDEDRPAQSSGARNRSASPDDDEFHDAQTRLPGRMPRPDRNDPDDRPRSRPDRSR